MKKRNTTNERGSGSGRAPSFLSILLVTVLLLNLIPTYALADVEIIDGEEIDWDGTTVQVTITSNIPLNISSKEDKTAPSISLGNSLMSPISLKAESKTENSFTYSGVLREVWGNWDAESIIFSIRNYQDVLDVQAQKVRALSINGVSISDSKIPQQRGESFDTNIDNFNPTIRTGWNENGHWQVAFTTDSYNGENLLFPSSYFDDDWGTFIPQAIANISIDIEFEELTSEDPLYVLNCSYEKEKGNIITERTTAFGNTFTVTASANPGYEYDGYTLKTESRTETAAWDSINYIYDTKEYDTDNMGDSRRSTATFDVTITEDSTLEFHFKEIDKARLFDGNTVTLLKGSSKDDTYVSLTPSYPPGNSQSVTSYKPGDYAYINLYVPLHGSISYTASEEPVSISVYAGNGETGELGDLLVSGSNQFSTGQYGLDGKWVYYPNNCHPAKDPNTGTYRGLSLDMRLQLPKTDYITAVVEWPAMGTWTFPIKVMDTSDKYTNRLQDVYNSLYKAEGYNPFRYNLNYVYDEEMTKLIESVGQSDAQRELLCQEAIQKVKDAAAGKGTDAVVWWFSGKASAKGVSPEVYLNSGPILIAVPANANMNGETTMLATLDAISPGKWTWERCLGGFGAAINRVSWGQEWDTKETEIVHYTNVFGEYGDYGSFYNDRDGYSKVGVTGYKTYDGAIMAWNQPASDTTWYRGLLRYYCSTKLGIPLDVMTSNRENENAALLRELQKRDPSIQTLQDISYTAEYLNKLFPTDDLDDNGIQGDDFRRYGIFTERSEEAAAVIQLIRAIGTVNRHSGAKITAAEEAYDKLTDDQKKEVYNYQDLVDARAKLVALLDSAGSSVTDAGVNEALTAVLTSFQGKTPVVGSTGGEWAVLSVARWMMTKPNAPLPEGQTEPDDDVKYAKKYLTALDRTLRDKTLDGMDPTGNQHTEYSRIVLALSALGIDAENYQAGNGGNYNIVAKLKETNAVISQGINGPVFALLALDSKPYYPENTALRQTYIKEILSKQINDGGFSYNGVESDVDMTAMAIQALAPYYPSDLDVQKAVNRALTTLSKMQDSLLGGFYSGGTYNSESCSQVIVALTALAYHTGSGTLNSNSWTVCGTTFKNPVNALMAFYKDGKFGHALGEQDDMATEQAAYALVAYNRYQNKQPALYTMQDAFEAGSSETNADRAAVEAARAAVVNAFTNLDWLNASLATEEQIRTAVTEKLPTLASDITAAVTVNAVSAPVPGTQANPNGTDGEAAFTVTLTKGSVTLTAAFGTDFPAKKYVSGDFGLRSVTILGKAGKFRENDPYTILVTLEKELAEQGFRFDQAEIQITPKDSGAKVVNLRQTEFDTWAFAIEAENGNCSPDYTIRVEFSDDPAEIAQANVEAAASIVATADNETLPASVDAASKEAIAQWTESLIPESADVTQKAEITNITEPVDGTRDNPSGTNGTATIKVTITDTYVADSEQSAGIEDDSQEQLDAAWEKVNAAKTFVKDALSIPAELPAETDAGTLNTWAAAQLAAIPNWDDEVKAEISVTVEAPIAGTAESPEGTSGKAAFTVTLTCMAGETQVEDTLTVERELPAAAYVPPVDPAAPPEENQNQNDVPQEEEEKTPAPDDSIIKEPELDEGEKQPDEPKAEDKTANDPTAADTVPDMTVQALSIVSNAPPEAVKTVQKEITITVILPAKPYVPSSSTRILSLTYNGTPLTVDNTGYVYTLELPYGEMLNTAHINIQTEEGSTAGSLTDMGNGLYQFTVTAEDEQTKATYSINVTSVSGTKEENQNAVNAAYMRINSLDSWTVPSETVKNMESGVRTYINTSIAGLTGGVSSKIEITSLTAAKDGSKENVKGTDGSYTATITLSKGIYGSSTYVEEAVTIEGTITAKAFEAKPEGEITVTFTLLGDDDHGDPGTTNTHTLAGGNLDTWIPTQTVTVPAGSTVGDVFSMVLDEWGYRYIGLESNYIKTIITPRGLRLSEFTNGQLSGWMYTVNGEHPNQGLNKWEVYDGDEIIWHYTDDYTQERGGTGSSNTSSTELTPTAVVRNGVASASVSNDDLLGAVQAAVQNRIGNILIAPAGAERADTLSVSLPADALSEAGYSGVGVTVESGAGIVAIPGSAVSSIARTARGYDVIITTAAQSVYEAERLLGSEELTEDQLTGCSVTEVTITSGSTNITSWNGGNITLSLPVDSRNFEARERYTVYQISDDGSMEKHTGRCVKQGGALYVEIDVTHLSTFIVVPTAAETVEEEKIPEALPTNIYLPFADTMNHWALDSIGFVYQRGLMSGTGANSFQPDANMSRAMFVTVLHRLEGTPASNGMTAYTDVETGTWYTNAVSWATAAGIVNGTGANTFSPNASITREEMATMMMRYAKYKGYDTAVTAELAGYADAYQINDWAYRAMEWANGTGMITGRTVFSLEPQGTATRAETATILMRFIQKFVSSTPDLY